MPDSFQSDSNPEYFGKIMARSGRIRLADNKASTPILPPEKHNKYRSNTDESDREHQREHDQKHHIMLIFLITSEGHLIKESTLGKDEEKNSLSFEYLISMVSLRLTQEGFLKKSLFGAKRRGKRLCVF